MQLSTYEVIERELTRLMRSLEHAHRRMLQAGDVPHHLERAAHRLLAHIVDGGPVRLSVLAELACVDTSTASRQISQLEAQGLVARQTDPADGRAALLAATDDGAKLLLRTRAARGRFVRELVGAWPSTDRKELGRLLTQFNDGVAQSTSSRQGVS